MRQLVTSMKQQHMCAAGSQGSMMARLNLSWIGKASRWPSNCSGQLSGELSSVGKMVVYFEFCGYQCARTRSCGREGDENFLQGTVP